jgi:hypothetical protein
MCRDSTHTVKIKSRTYLNLIKTQGKIPIFNETLVLFRQGDYNPGLNRLVFRSYTWFVSANRQKDAQFPTDARASPPSRQAQSKTLCPKDLNPTQTLLQESSQTPPSSRKLNKFYKDCPSCPDIQATENQAKQLKSAMS